MKLTAKIKLLPNEEERQALLDTLKTANAACNEISSYAWENKVFRQFNLHKGTYYTIKNSFALSSQVVVRCIAKVADSYKLDRRTQRTFQPFKTIAYDSRIIRYKFPENSVSIWTVNGRTNINYVVCPHHQKLLKFQKGETDLAYIKGKFYLLATCEVPEQTTIAAGDVLGVDLGLTYIATDDTGQNFQGKELNKLRKKREKIRGSLQCKGTRGAKKVLKRLSGRERTTTKIVNHTIAKKLVEKVKKEQKAICLEDLKGIRDRTNQRLRKSQKGLHNRCGSPPGSFHQLRQFIAYKAQREGIPLVFAPPAYTSQTCSCCHHIGKRNGEDFKCTNCGYEGHADTNAAINIRSWGRTIVTRPEESTARRTALSCNYIPIVGHVCQV